MNPYIRAAERQRRLREEAQQKLQARLQEAPPEPTKLVRARDAEGQYIGDDPATPDVNEAWVEVPQEPGPTLTP